MELEKYWSDAVEILECAGITEMRQPHYFMGLYPYTYSEGLTLGMKTPLELAMMVGVNLVTDQTLIDVIGEVSTLIDDIYFLF